MTKSASDSWQLCILLLWTLPLLLSCVSTSLNDETERELQKQTMAGAKFTTVSMAQAAKQAISELFDRIQGSAKETAHLILGKAATISLKLKAYSPGSSHEAKAKDDDEGKGEGINRKAYEMAQQRVCEACKTAKDSMSEESRITYGEAKEQSSKATGELGSRLRTEQDEL